MRALSWLRFPRLSASPPEPSRSAGGHCSSIRPASSADSPDLSAARALRRGLAAALLCLPLLAVLATGAQADVLASNLNQASSTGTNIANLDRGQIFRTGDNPQGYVLNSVDVQFRSISIAGAFQIPTKLKVTIRDNSGFSVIGALSIPAVQASSSPVTHAFTAPAGGIWLAANTRYRLFFDVLGPMDSVKLADTSSNSIDNGAASGWDIADQHFERSWSSTGGFTAVQESLKIGINGAPWTPAPGLTFSQSSLTVPEHDDGSYTVKLASRPTGDVTVAIGGATSTVTVSPQSLTFTASNWHVPRTVTVSATTDSDETDDRLTLRHTASGGGYGGVAEDLAVTVSDTRRSARLCSGPTHGVTPEVLAATVTFEFAKDTFRASTTPGGGSATVTVVRTGAGHEDSVAASVDYETGDGELTAPGGYTHTAGTLHFGAGERSKSFTVPLGVSAGTFEVYLSNPVGDSVVCGGARRPWGSTVRVHAGARPEARPAGLVLSRSTLDVPEGGGASWTVKLAGEPAGGDVTVAIAGHSGTDVTVTPTALTFTATDWNRPQAVTLGAGDDGDAADDSVTLAHTASGADYGSVSASLPVRVHDDDRALPVIAFAKGSHAVDEDAGTVDVTVTKTGAGAATVHWATRDGNAKSGSDFTRASGTLSFGASETEKTVTVTILDDSAVENPEMLSLSLSNPGGATLGKSRTYVVVKDDDTGADVIEFAEANYTVNEGTDAVLSVTRTGGAGTVTVDYLTLQGTAIPGTDYTTTNGTLTFGPNVFGQTITVPVRDADNVSQVSRALVVNLSSPGGGAVLGPMASTLMTINDLPLIEFKTGLLNLVRENEGHIHLKVEKKGAGAATVGIRMDDLTATLGVDYSLLSPSDGTLEFVSSETEKTITFLIHDDDLAEENELFRVYLQNPVGGTVVTGTQRDVVIQEDDDIGILTADAVDVQEGGSAVYGLRLGTMPVFRTDGGSVTVTITSDNADVTVDTDSGTPGDQTTLTFTDLDWNTDRNVTVSAAGDANTLDETVTLTHTASSAGGSDYDGRTRATRVTVTDTGSNSPQVLPTPVTVTLSADATSVTEGGDVTFTVTATPAPQADLPVTVSVDEEMGSGQNRVGGTLIVPALTIRAGTTSASYTVTAMDDNVQRADGTMTGSIVAGDGYTAGTPSTVTLDLLDDDGTTPDSAVGQSVTDSTPAIDPDLVAKVRARAAETQHGTAHVNRWKRVLVAFGLETYPGLTPTTAAEARANAQKYSSPLWPEIAKILTVLEGAATLPVVTLSAGSDVTEGSDAVFTLTASPAPASALPVSVTVATDGDWGVSAGSRTVTFAPGAATATLTLATTDDQADEPDGSVTATVTGGAGYTVGAASSGTVAVADNDDAPATPLPVVTISGGTGVTEGGTAIFELAASSAPAAPLAVTVTVAADGDWGVTAGTHTVTIGTHGFGHLRLATADDAADEPDGSITATLQDGDGYTAGDPASGTVAVADDDLPLPVVTLSAGDAVTEGGDAVFTLTADRAPDDYLTVRVTVSETGDHVGADNEGARGVTFLAGETTVTLAVATVDDALDEPDGAVTVTLTDGDGYAVGDPASGAVAVEDDDLPPPVVSIAADGASVTEGGDAAFTVTADRAVDADLTVTLSVSEAAEADHVAAADEGAQTVTIAKGATEAAFTVATVDDAADEPDGSLTVSLSAGEGYVVAAAPADAAAVKVTDNDAAAGPALYVDDATLREGEAWVMAFTVRLSPPAPGPVSVHVSTQPSDPQSAEPGVDYSKSTSQLLFRAGETAKTVNVLVYDDSHDEDPETFQVVLSKAQGATIGDGVAVGTITNDDPLPGAWLARFGRTVAEQALDGIAGRMAAPRTPGMQGTLAGQGLDFGAPSDAGAAQGDPAPGVPGGSGAHALSGVAQAFGSHPVGPGGGLGEAQVQPHTLTARDALLSSRFTLTGEEDVGGGSFAFWGWASQGYFDGTERGDGTDVTLDGTVTTGMLGADYARGQWLLGLALMQSSADGGYTGGCAEADGAACGGDVEASLTAAVPYALLEASPRLRIWTALGYGTGDVTLGTGMGGRLEAGTDWQMAALGLRGDVFAPAAGPGLALTSDALWTRTQSEAVQGLASSDSSVTRLRLGLEGNWAVSLSGLGTLTPKLEMGLRHDGGDVETGFGVELGGGIAWLAPAYGLSLSLEGRTLVAHETDLEDSGVSVALSFDPDPASARGPSVSLRQSVGGQATGGVAALFGSQALVRRAGTGEMGGLWSAEASWGFAAFGGRFTGSPHVGYALSDVTRDYTLGWRLEPVASQVSLGVAASQREHDGAATEHVVGLEVRSGW